MPGLSPESLLTLVTYPGAFTISVSYDANDSKTGMVDSHGSWSWVYDNNNRCTGATDAGGRSVSNTYDFGGRRTQLTRQDGSAVTYGYDGGGRLTSLSDSTISPAATTMSYDNASNVTGMTLSNGATVARSYDTLERLTGVTNRTSANAVLSSYSYGYDNDSERTSVTEGGGSQVAWSYDALHRLTGEVRTGTAPYSYSYTVDSAGNRLTWVNNSTLATTTYGYDNANHLLSANGGAYGYDADGNRTSVTVGGTTTTYGFDYEDRLAGIGANVSYSYIGAGTDRYSKTVNGTTTQFLYDGGSVVEELQGTTVTATYGAGAEKLNGVVSWMLQDGQGSTRQLLNSSQAVTATYNTDAYGNDVSTPGNTANPFRSNAGSAYYSDGESGLQKVGARYYDPAVGRFISQDSMLVAGSPADSPALNRYNYCESNPVGGADPSGHDKAAAQRMGYENLR